MTQRFRHSLVATLLSCAAGWHFSSGLAAAQTDIFVASSNLGSASQPTNFVLPSFSTDQGTLNSVDITLVLDFIPVVSAISVYNSTNTTEGFTNASIVLPVAVTGPGALDLSTSIGANVASGQANPGVTNYSLPASPISASAQVLSENLDLWEGQPGNTVSLAVTPGFPTFQGTAQGGGLFFGGSATESGTITVQYSFTPANTAVPEPRGAYLTALVGLAMMACVVGRRRTAGI